MHVCFCCVCFSFSVLSQEIGCEERLRNDLFLCQVGRKTLTQLAPRKSFDILALYKSDYYYYYYNQSNTPEKVTRMVCCDQDVVGSTFAGRRSCMCGLRTFSRKVTFPERRFPERRCHEMSPVYCLIVVVNI